MSVMTENTLAGSGGLLRCANNALMDWIMSPSSGQAIIWQSGSGLCACRALTCRAARLYPRALTGSKA